MSSADSTELPIVETSVPCRHLRNKGMYVYTDGSGESHGDYDNTIFWCLKTMTGFGPDDTYVGREECCNVNRACFEPL